MLIVTIGAPGSGKTTAVQNWYQEYLSAGRYGWAYNPRVHISRDGLRTLLGVYGSQDDYPSDIETHVTMAEQASVARWLENEIDVAVDDTCQSEEVLYKWCEIAWNTYTYVVVWDFRNVPIDTCVSRDKARDRVVGEKVIRKIAKRCASVIIPDRVESIVF